MSRSIVLKEKSLLQSSTSPSNPQVPATGLTAGSIEPAASGSVPLNTFSQYLLLDPNAERYTKNTGILSKKLVLRLSEYAL